MLNRGYKVGTTRDNDYYVSLRQRSNLANNNNADILISLHTNAFSNPSANGIETFHHANSSNGKKLADYVHSEIKDLYRSDRGLKTNNLHMTRETKMPSILIELGFITNEADMQVTLNNKDKIVEGIANGVDRYFNKPVDNTPKPTKELFRVRKEWRLPQSQNGAYSVLENAIEQAKKLGGGYKVFDSKGKQVYPTIVLGEQPSSYHKEDWEWGIANGITDGSNPKQPATREQIITMLRRLKDFPGKPIEVPPKDKPVKVREVKEVKDGMVSYVSIPIERIKEFKIAVANNSKESIATMKKRFNSDYMINGGFFWTSADVKWKNYSINTLVSEGVEVQPQGDFSKAGIGMTKENKLVVERYRGYRAYSEFIGGSPNLITSGKVNIDHTIGHENQRHPRSAIGITKDNMLILIAVDGRRKDKPGMTLKELADYMLKLNIKNGINLDGGGSTRLESKTKVLNSPTENRLIHNAIGIKLS